ncbi:MAG: CHASE domain-containing protein [Xanthobacteraceae bacterium]|nr:CHASE domain-containing protein [Xanthobacteraceae bacterium]
MVRVGFFIAVLALIGVVISGLAAFRVYDQESSIDRSALTREVDIHANLIQERLGERELLARVSIGIFKPSSVISANALAPLRAYIYAFKTDFVVASWVARIGPADFQAVQNELKRSGFGNPTIRGFNDMPADLSAIREPVDILMDVEPQNDKTSAFPGRIVDQHPIIGPMIQQAMQSGAPASSNPIELFGRGGQLGIVLAAPVFKEGTKTVIGFITISYRLASLMLSNDDLSLFAVSLTDPRSSGDELGLDSSGEIELFSTASRTMRPLTRKVTFGGREWTLNYYPKTNSTERARELAYIVALIGASLTTIVCGLFGYVSYNNVRLSREVEARIGFERRLTAVIDELNHRVKNILAVIQSIVTRTLRHGSDIDVARELLIGRIHAMSNVVTLLSDSQWQGVKLKGLFESRAIPHADRIAIDGPDITVSARAAQSLSLLFFELASHSDEGLSLVGKHPHIVANWTVTGQGHDEIFSFRWEEFNTSVATRRPDSDFGIVLLDRVAPEALGGTSKRYFTDVSYVYELTAPMVTVVDEHEMDRTGRIAGSV